MSASLDGLIVDSYRLTELLGRGGHGVVYLGEPIAAAAAAAGPKHVAVKLETERARNSELVREADYYSTILQGTAGIARLHWFGHVSGHNALVMDLLGPSLADLLAFCGEKFSMKTVLMLADQLIDRIASIHCRGLIHRSVKPSNFLMGADGDSRSKIFIIDFGKAKRYVDANTGRHIAHCNEQKFIWTRKFASVRAHLGEQQSRRDDLESLGYVFVYFLRGSLPWAGQPPAKRTATATAAAAALKSPSLKTPKTSISVEVLCKGLPAEFATYIKYCRDLAFAEAPNYAYIRRLFRGLFESLGYQDDAFFDWNKTSTL